MAAEDNTRACETLTLGNKHRESASGKGRGFCGEKRRDASERSKGAGEREREGGRDSKLQYEAFWGSIHIETK